MENVEDTISLFELGLYPDTDCLVHILGALPRALAESFADEILKGKNIDAETAEKLKTEITKNIAKVFYLGAQHERQLIDKAVALLGEQGLDTEPGIPTFYRSSLANVAKSAVSYVRESVRTDHAHKGRMPRSEGGLKATIELAIGLWKHS